ncbi:MAG TPA: FkbM family methyltransferase [Actinomycetota bacterium]|nr:FkbM family methyltransferase [Actinomycetota bacterium]
MREGLRRAVFEAPWDAVAALYHRTRRTPLVGPLMLRAIEARTNGARWIRARVRMGPLAGMRLDIDARVQADVVVGAYERRLSRHVGGILRPGDTAFDVGSHLGYFGILMATAVGSGGTVVCFEPDPGLHEALEGNLARNGDLIPGDVSVARLGIGATRGKTSFEAGGHSTRGRLIESGGVEVDVITLDDAVERFGTPRFVKVDVEGGELDVLAGGPGIVASRVAHFGIEIHSPELGDACRKLMEESGYDCRFITEAGRAETYLLAEPASPSARTGA